MVILLALLLSLVLTFLPISNKGGVTVAAAKEEQLNYLNLNDYQELKLREESKTREDNKTVVGQIPKKMITFKPKAVNPTIRVSTDYEELFDKYGKEYGVNKQVLSKIAYCESTFNPNAVNGPYAGMFQFVTSTWVADRKSMGLDPDPNLRFNAEEAVKTTAYKISRGGIGAWPVCGKR